jgi:hypothetical protein
VLASGSLRICDEVSSARAFATEPGIALAAFVDDDGGGDFAGADAGADAFDEVAFDEAACSARRYQQ